jgi:hypothetical protein
MTLLTEHYVKPELKYDPLRRVTVHHERDRAFVTLPCAQPVQTGSVVVHTPYGIRPAKATDLYMKQGTFFGIAAQDGFYGDEIKILVRGTGEAILP